MPCCKRRIEIRTSVVFLIRDAIYLFWRQISLDMHNFIGVRPIYIEEEQLEDPRSIQSQPSQMSYFGMKFQQSSAGFWFSIDGQSE